MLETSELSRIMSSSAKFYPPRERRDSIILELSDNINGAILQEVVPYCRMY